MKAFNRECMVQCLLHAQPAPLLLLLLLLLSGLQTLQHNPYTQPLWKAAVAQYERGVAPAEVRIAGKLRIKLQQLQAQPHLLLREFQRYRELIKRPNISKELTTERYGTLFVLFIILTIQGMQ